MEPAAGEDVGQGSRDGGRQTGGDTAIDSQQSERETLKRARLKSMPNFASNETPAFFLASKRAS